MRHAVLLAAAALMLVSAVPALASQGDATTVEVPAWAWSLLAGGLVAGGGLLTRLVVWSIQRELRPLEALVAKVDDLDKRQTRTEAKVDAMRLAV